MKIDGVLAERPGHRILPLPRVRENGEEYFLTFTARAADMAKFEALCPLQKPPGALTRDGWVPDRDDPRYKQVLQQRARQRWAFVMVDSLEPSHIEWENVEPENPATWKGYEEELRAVLLPREFDMVAQLVGQANCLDDEYLERAKDFFFRQRELTRRQTSRPDTDDGPIESGEPASLPASDPPA